MPEKQDYTQPELFSPSDASGQYRPAVRRNPFILRIRGYEKVMLIIMGVVVVGIICFSLGVEKGKSLNLSSDNSQQLSGFTIQLANFRDKDTALRQAKSLAKDGLNPMLFAKDNYIVLCVGKFSNQESAQPLLNQLQRTYAGCRIRRL